MDTKDIRRRLSDENVGHIIGVAGDKTLQSGGDRGLSTRLGELVMASLMRYERSAHAASSDHPLRHLIFDPHDRHPVRTPVSMNDTRSLSTLIESEIIPRLMVAHATEPSPPNSDCGEQPIDPSEIDAFVPMVMDVEADRLLAHIETILARNVSVESVMVDLLAPAARQLGVLWEEDRCDFVDVTMGLWRLQEIVHEIASRAPSRRSVAAGRHRVLFASMPGDQHNFGTVVIDELFRRNGWLTERVSDAETADLLRRVERDWFDMVGLTISCDCHIASLSSIIAALRNVSRNPLLCVMVGGRVLGAMPELAAQVGADGTALDAKLALEVAAELVRQREWEAADCH